MAACIAVTGLWASEYHGVVTANGVPVPGATVTAMNADKKAVTTTDENGAFSFPELADGLWTIQVDMLGFVKFSKEVGVQSDAPAPTFELKPMTESELKAALAPPPAAPAAATPGTPPTTKPTAAAASGTPAPAAAGTSTTAAASNGQATSTGKPTAAAATANNSNGKGNRPSIRAAQAARGGGGGGFTRLDVNASGDAGSGMESDTGMSNGDLAQSSNDAFVVNGSISSAAGIQGGNDWGGPGGPGGMFGPGGMGMMGPNGMGGPGDGQGPNGLNGDGAGGGGRGGRGGGGPGGGGPGMMGVGGPGGGGGFGGRGGGGGFGGPGGRGGAGGRGGRGGRGNPNSFGNGRRNARARYNGNVAFVLDNSVWDARPFSLTGQDTPKPSTSNARMTAMFGGPLKIPHVVSGEHTTFTINYQFTRARTGSTQSALVPTAAERGGDFSNALTTSGVVPTIYNNGSPFPNNQIPQSMISSTALGLLAYTPLPNFSAPNSRYNYQVGLVGVNNQDNINSRINHTINSKNQIFGNFSYQRADGRSPSLYIDPNNGNANLVSLNHQSAYNSGINWTYHFTSRLINTLGYTFSRNNTNLTPYFANRVNLSGQLGVTGNDQASAYWGPPGLSFSNGFSVLGDGSTTAARNNTSALSEAVRWFRGTHQFTFGGDVRRVQTNPTSEANARGSFTFNGTYTSLAGATNSGYDFADFLLGKPDTDQIAYGNADKYFRNGWFDGYINDNWQMNPKFSVQWGLRWDYQLPTTELYGRLVNMAIGQGFTSATEVCAAAPPSGAPCALASQYGLPSSLLRGDPHEFQPRVGIAWRPFSKHTTVVRSGWGIYYNTSVFQSLVSSGGTGAGMSQQAPFSTSYINPDPAGMFFCTPGAAGCNLSGNAVSTFAVDPNFRIGYSQNWQASIQHNVTASIVATITYAGAKGTHQPQELIPNSAPPGSTYVCSAGYTCPTNYYYVTPGGNSISNNLWLQLQRRFRSGLSWQALYAHADSIDDVGSAGGRGQGSALIAQNWLDLEAERAHTAGIRTHTLSTQVQYSTGMGAAGGALMKGFKGSLFREWTFTANSTVASGAPLTPSVVARTLGGTGISGPLRAFYWGGPIFINGQLNPAAFTAPPEGEYGNAGRDIIWGPRMFSLNGSAERTFRVGERKSINLRFAANNMLNHVAFGSWNTTVGSSQFGALQSPNGMRDLTATLRFRF